MGQTAQRVFSFVVRYKEENDGVAPSYSEIMAACYISRTTVHHHLKQLEKDGHIKRVGDTACRNIQVVGGKWQLKVLQNK
jgi:DNA-binding HxlR family transcriptional regulator